MSGSATATASSPTVDPEYGVTAVERLITAVRPHTVVTFGPEGMTGHDDHRTVSAWVTRAWRRTGCSARLWYATVTPDFHTAWGEVNESLGLWFDPAAAPSTPAEDLAAQVRLEDRVLDRKVAALHAHRSQTEPLVDLLGAERYRAWWSTESFVAA